MVFLVDWARLQDKMFRPDLVREQFPEIALQAALNTLIFTFFGFSGGLVLGLGLALMRISPIGPYRWFAAIYIDVIRGLPALLRSARTATPRSRSSVCTSRSGS